MNRLDEAEKLTQEDKMKLWHDGKRGFNYKTATPEKLRTNFKICKKLGFKAECKLLSDELKKRGLKIAGKDLDSVKESRSLHERGMTEYGVSHADEIYRDNYERELAKSGDKYIVRPRTQATNRYLTGDFGVRDSYELSFGTLRDLVRTCVNSNDDIELYETGDDYYFKDDGRIYDVLGFVNGSLNESLVNKFLNQKKMKEYRVDLNGRKEDHISSRKLEDFLKTKGCDFNVVGDGIYEVYIDSKDRYYVEIFTKSGLGSNIYEMRCIRSDAGVTQDLMMKWKGYSFDEFVTDLKDAYNAYGDRPLR